jgi:hypothetical protein
MSKSSHQHTRNIFHRYAAIAAATLILIGFMMKNSSKETEKQTTATNSAINSKYAEFRDILPEGGVQTTDEYDHYQLNKYRAETLAVDLEKLDVKRTALKNSSSRSSSFKNIAHLFIYGSSAYLFFFGIHLATRP